MAAISADAFIYKINGTRAYTHLLNTWNLYRESIAFYGPSEALAVRNAARAMKLKFAGITSPTGQSSSRLSFRVRGKYSEAECTGDPMTCNPSAWVYQVKDSVVAQEGCIKCRISGEPCVYPAEAELKNPGGLKL